MDRQQIGVKLALNGLERPLKVDEFDDRLILQKAIYLAQAKGIHLGYYYKWYLHGPYCSSLTKDLYAIDTEGKYASEECKRWNLDKESSTRLKELAGLFSESDTKTLARNLELLASIHFLVDREQVSNKNPDEIKEVLDLYDKGFSEEEVVHALGVLEEHDLLSQ